MNSGKMCMTKTLKRMKTTTRFILAVAAICAGWSCQQSPDEFDKTVIEITDGVEISVEAHAAGIGNNTAASAAGADGSRVVFDQSNYPANITFKWADSGESFTSFRSGVSPLMQFSQVGEGGATTRFSGVVESSWNDATPIYSVYPAVQSGSATGVEVDLTAQTGTLNNDRIWMYANATLGDMKGSGMNFHHLTSVLEVSLLVPTVASGTVSGVTLSSDALAAKASVNLTDRSVGTPSATTVALGGSVALAESVARIYVYMLPTTLNAPITVNALVDGVPYTGTIPARTGGKAIEAGKIYHGASVELVEVAQTQYYVTPTGSASAAGTSWSNPTSLVNALSKAQAGNIVHLAAGIYTPDTNLDYTGLVDGAESKGFFIGRNITLQGGYPESPAIGAVPDVATYKATISGDGKSYHVLAIASPRVAGERVTLNGLIITGGNCNGSSSYQLKVANLVNSVGGTHAVSINADMGGGVAAMSSVVEMNYVNITGNAGTKAVGIFSLNSDVTMNNCLVKNNTATSHGAVMLQANSNYDVALTMNNTPCQLNKASGSGSVGGLYVRGNGGMATVNANNVWFDQNEGIGAAAVKIEYADANFTNCVFSRNRGVDSGNRAATIYIQHSESAPKSVVASDIVFDKCRINKNNDNLLNGSAIYAYLKNAVEGVDINLSVMNSVIENNVIDKERTIFLRNQNASSLLNADFVNTTIAGNCATHSSAMALNSANNGQVKARLISCTVTGNTYTNATSAKHGAICLETANVRLETYNSIITGNLHGSKSGTTVTTDWDGKTPNNDVHHNHASAVQRHYGSFVGTRIYGAKYYGLGEKSDNLSTDTEAQLGKPFHYKSMLAALAQDGGTDNLTCRLNGDARVNSAFTAGQSKASLQTLAGGPVTAAVLGTDQNGTDRAGRVMGACVTPSGAAPVALNQVYFGGGASVKLFDATGIADGGSYASGLLWEWDGVAHKSEVSKDKDSYMEKIDECKPADFGSKLLITSSNHWLVVLDMDQIDPVSGNYGKTVFGLRDCHGAHSAELLPGNVIAIACSDGGTDDYRNKLILAKIPAAGEAAVTAQKVASSSSVLQILDLPAAHAVVWNDKHQRLYAVDYSSVYAYTFADNALSPEYNTGAACSWGWHDLTVIDEDTLLVSGSTANTFSMAARQFTGATYAVTNQWSGESAIKSSNYNPCTGQMWTTVAKACTGEVTDDTMTYSTRTLRYAGNANDTSSQKGIVVDIPAYKVRVLNW